jgi:5'-3' exonuclease
MYNERIYIKYAVPINKIKELITENIKKLVFFIDLQSICKGFYNRNNIFFEINHYMENNTPSEKMIKEYAEFLNYLYGAFKNVQRYFVTFYDDGKNIQNKFTSTSYKSNRKGMSDIITDDKELMVFYEIKNHYFSIIEEKMNKPGLSKVFYLKEYESDMIPYYVLKNKYFDTDDDNTLCIILSSDKDLLQCCQFKNTYQCINRYFSSKKKFEISLYDDSTAIEYLYDKFKPGILTSKHIPMILSIAGDKADKIDGVSGLGYVKTIKLIQNCALPTTPWEIKSSTTYMPEVITNNIQLIEDNFKLIDFNSQLTRSQELIRTLEARGMCES